MHPRLVRRKILLFLLAAILPGAAGCSSFNRDWKRAAQDTNSTADVLGAWDGEWRSAVNGHHGRLRCIVTRTDSESLEARYRANYWGFLRFGYTVTMQEEGSGTNRQFRGAANLGKLAGGKYEYAATLTPSQFSSTYSNRYDHGTFQMQRPAPTD